MDVGFVALDHALGLGDGRPGRLQHLGGDGLLGLLVPGQLAAGVLQRGLVPGQLTLRLLQLDLERCGLRPSPGRS